MVSRTNNIPARVPEGTFGPKSMTSSRTLPRSTIEWLTAHCLNQLIKTWQTVLKLAKGKIKTQQTMFRVQCQ